MAKIKVFNISTGGRGLWFFCPGCKMHHAPQVDKPAENGAMWTWNEDIDKPTIQPSILVFKDDPDVRCHSYVTNGMIQFLDDCGHSLKGKTVEIPEWEG